MIEIFVIIKLCMMNRRDAKANGRKGWVYVLLTIFLWLGMEVLGTIPGLLICGEHWLTYVIALIFAIAGGVLSRFLSNREIVTNLVEVKN